MLWSDQCLLVLRLVHKHSSTSLSSTSRSFLRLRCRSKPFTTFTLLNGSGRVCSCSLSTFTHVGESSLTTRKLTSQEEDAVLQRLNSMTLEDMRQVKGISSNAARNVCLHREKNGPFQKLQDLEEVKRVGLKSLKALYHNVMLDEVPATSDDAQRKSSPSFESTAKLLSPTLTQEFLQTVDKITSLEFGTDALFYTTIDRDLQVHEWSHIPWEGMDYLKHTPSKIMEEAHRISELLPPSDMFLIEIRVLRKRMASHIPMLLFTSRLQTAVQTVLNVDWRTTREHRVFHVKEFLTVKSFDLLVGNERVSGQLILQQMEDREFDPQIEVTNELWRHFNRQSEVVKERYRNSLLLAAAFCMNIGSPNLKAPAAAD